MTTFPLMTVVDDSGAVVAGATVAIASVTDKAGTAITSPGATVNLAGPNVTVDYDPEAKGEAWVTLSISKVGSTFTGTNASRAFYLARDSARILACLPATGLVNANVYVNGVAAHQGDGIASAVASSAITLDSTDPSAGSDLSGWRVRVISATTGAGQVQTVTSSNTSTRVQTLSGSWATTPTGTVVYELSPPVPVSIGSTAPGGWLTSTSFATDAIPAAAISAGAVAKVQAGLATPTNIIGGTITTVTNVTNAPANGDFTAAMKSSLNASTPAAPYAGPSVGAIGGAAATAILIDPTKKLLTDLSGWVTTSNPATTTSSTVTEASIWSFAGRALTDKANFTLSTAYDPAKAAAPTAAANASAVVTAMATAPVGSVAGTVNAVTTPVTLAASQTLYAPARVGDAMILTSAYDPAKVAAPTASANATATAALMASSPVGGVNGNLTGSVGSVGAPVTLSTAYDAAKVAAPTAAANAAATVAGMAGSPVGSVTGSVASVTAPVTLTSAYDPAKTAAQASQIPSGLTSALFASPGVFSTGALANTPSGLASLGSTAPAGWLNAAAFATDALGANAVSSAAVTKIQTGLATGDTPGTTTLLGRLSIARAGYLDRLSTGVALAANGLDAVTVETGYSAKDALKVGLLADLATSTGNATTAVVLTTLPTPTRSGTTSRIDATMAAIVVNGVTVADDRTGTAVRLSTV